MKKIVAFCAVALTVLLLAGPAGAATLIHNDGFTANNQPLPGAPNYASNVAASGINWSATEGSWGVTGTQDIGLVWSTGGSGQTFFTYNWDGRGYSVQLDGQRAGDVRPNYYISFVPASSTVGVSITSFDLDAWRGGGAMAVDWYIRDATTTGTILDSGAWTKSNAGGRDTISPNYNGSLGQTLVLHFYHGAGDRGYLAMDNLSFDQIAPPSGTVILFR